MLIHAGVGLVSAVVAVTLPSRYIAFAGFAYFGIALLMAMHRLARKHRRQLQDT
jgi:membrane protein implicated in regulation of membrane protease activity